jgi:hypothetical protein
VKKIIILVSFCKYLVSSLLVAESSESEELLFGICELVDEAGVEAQFGGR